MGIRFTSKGRAAQRLEGFDFVGTLLEPLLINRTLGLWLARKFPGRSVGAYVGAQTAGALVAKLRPGQIVPDIPRNAEPRTGLSMGEHAAITAKEWSVAREAQDELAAASHRNLAAAYERGFFDDLVTPYLGLERDMNLRPDSSTEKLAKLKPVFGKGEAATMTAGNSTPLTDGASAVLLQLRWLALEGRSDPVAHLDGLDVIEGLGERRPRLGGRVARASAEGHRGSAGSAAGQCSC